MDSFINLGRYGTSESHEIGSEDNSYDIYLPSGIPGCLFPFASAAICDNRKDGVFDRQTNKEYWCVECGCIYCTKVVCWNVRVYKCDEHNYLTTEQDYTVVISIADLFAVSLPKSIKGVAGMEALTGVILTKRSEIRLHEKRRMYMLKTVEGRNEVQ